MIFKVNTTWAEFNPAPAATSDNPRHVSIFY